MRVLVTGASGFVGSAVCNSFASEDNEVKAVSRGLSAISGAENITHVSLSSWQDFPADCLDGVDVVVHAAARAHVMQDVEHNPLDEYRIANVELTLDLARKAAERGVQRFVFISSIKVNGESTNTQPFSALMPEAPEDDYGVSKFEAEQQLLALAKETALEVVIIRPPLVYGPGVKGNFASMIRLVNKGLPLPLGAVHNQRSLVALENLVDLIKLCTRHPAAANQIFLAGDGEDVSTTELLRGVAEAMNKPARLIPVPAGLLKLAATMVGKRGMADRLLGSLQVDISKARELLGWQPPLTVKEGLAKCFQMEK